MTMPNLMNCAHSEDGWCIPCVKMLYREKERYQNMLKEREIQIYRLSKCQSKKEIRECMDNYFLEKSKN
jgi:hypothetical protein